MSSKVWDEITDPFLNFNGLGMDTLFLPILHDGCNYLSMLGLKLVHINKMGPLKHPKRWKGGQFTTFKISGTQLCL